ncbi:MAG: VCBS repeat-containing protein [Acidobacteriota bacterium]
MPRLRSGNFDAQARAGDFISSGVADLLNMLREKDLKRSLDKDSSTTNPFEEALTTASNDEAPAKAKQTSSPDSAAKQVQKTADNPSSSGGDPAKTNGIFLFIGNFADQQVAATTATAQDLIVPSNSSAATFDLAGFGKQSFDLNIILRNPDNQESIAVGDLNGDGFPDLVITSRVNNRAFVYINDGQGNYVLKSDIYGGFGPAAAAIANFGGDGSPDIAVMLADDKRIVVDGNGLRRFIFLPTSLIDRVYSSIMPYDFDGDGVNDLLLTNYSDLTVSVYLNQKDATFVESTVLPLQSFPFLQSKADLNGDGIDDVVYVQHVGNQVSIVVVNGKDGSISSLANTISDPSIYYVLGDFNQDGVIDIAIAHRR